MRLKLVLQLVIKVSEILDTLLVRLLLLHHFLLELPLQLFNLLLVIFNVLRVLITAVLKVGNVCVHLILSLLGHQSFSHTIGDRRLIEILVSLNGHADLVAHSHEQEAPLSAVDRDLTDELIEALAEELFADWANSSLTGHLRLEEVVEARLQRDHIRLRRWLR